MASLLRLFKFRGFDFLGESLADEAFEIIGHELRDVDAVVPMPLHWRRLYRRGFNQSQLLADRFAATMGVPLLEALSRQPRPPQSRLSTASRARNVRGAFMARRRVGGLNLLLVDDVITTGATLREASKVLVRAGAASVVGLVMARAAEKRPAAL